MIKNRWIKKTVLTILAVFVIIAGVVFFYRYRIMQYSAEAFIRSFLPDYVTIDKITFSFQEGKASFVGFRILNSPGFSDKYLIEIEEISCSYKLNGKTLLDGIEIVSPVFKKPLIFVERLGDGRVNLQEMQKVVEAGYSKQTKAKKVKPKEPTPGKEAKKAAPGDKKLSDMVKLPQNFIVKSGKLIFTDRFVQPSPNRITFEDVEAKLFLRLDDLYAKVLEVSSVGKGDVNGKAEEALGWNIALNPTTSKLTMSNRFEVSGVEIKTFEPYYDRYSPFIFERGRFSGTLIFDFDNGNIGSTNEVHLTDLAFSVKPSHENAQSFGTTVQDLVKYFTSGSGEVVFDFKIKGDMASPTFYLGPISKRAITSMVVDKISSAIAEASKAKDGSGSVEAVDSGVSKARDMIEAFQSLIEKKK